MLHSCWPRRFAAGLLITALALTMYARPSLASGQIFIVDNVNDAGVGSLRQAILDANANPGFDTIHFRIASEPDSDGMHVISLYALLPPITQIVMIDGASQPGYSPESGPVIEINGGQIIKTCRGVESGAYRDHPGFDIVNNSTGDASGTTIKRVKVSSFCQGISISANLDNPQSNCLNAPDAGLRISGVTVQDSRLEDNLNGNAAVDLCFARDASVKNNVFARNGDHIEVTRSELIVIDGNEASDAQDGIELVRSQQVTVKNNRFSNNRRNGIVSVFEASNNVFLNNQVTAVAAMGLVLSNGNVARGNTISGAGWFGIEIRGGSNNVVSENIVKNNGLGGIAVNAGTFLFLARCTVQSDGIPSNCGVRASLMNLGMEGDAFNNVISNNEVALNHGPGVVVGGRFNDLNGNERRAANNRLSANLIYANDGLGIDLSDQTQSVYFAAEEPIVGAYGEIVSARADGPTPNNSGLAANRGQNFPVLTSALAAPGQLVVKGVIDAPDPRNVTIEFFANPTPTPGGDPSSHGEGAIFLGASKANVNGQFTAALPPAPAGTLVTATATDADGNTSEYAENIEAQFPPK